MLLSGTVALGAVAALLASSVIASLPEIAANASQGLNQIRQWLTGPPLNLAQGQFDAALQSRSLNLHAGVVLLAVTVGSSLFGIVGAFLAVPVAATGAAVLRYLSEQANAATSATPQSSTADSEAPPNLSGQADPAASAIPGWADTPPTEPIERADYATRPAP